MGCLQASEAYEAIEANEALEFGFRTSCLSKDGVSLLFPPLIRIHLYIRINSYICIKLKTVMKCCTTTVQLKNQ